MAPRYGGTTPFNYGLRLSVEAPAGTSTSVPVVVGQVFKIGGTAADGSGYKLVALTGTDDPLTCVMVQALTGATDVSDVTVAVLGPYSQVRRAVYEGSPTIGQSIDAAPTSQRKVEGVTWVHGQGYITFVDATATEVEFII
jgi:hypothetical protein